MTPVSGAASTPADSAGRPGRETGTTPNERRRWLAALIVAFALGFLLAWYLLRQPQPQPQLQPHCARSPQDGSPPVATGSGRGDGAPGRGSSVKLGSADTGVADHKGSGLDSPAEGGGPAAGGGKPGEGSLRGGQAWQAQGDDQNAHGRSSAANPAVVGGQDARGEAPDGGGGEGQKTLPQQAAAGPSAGPARLYPEAGDTESSGAAKAAAAPAVSGAGDHVAVATDLRFDKSELPRYPNGVAGVASGTTLPPGARAPSPNVSVSAILTTDDPGTVASWYQAHLPPDWSEMNLGGLAMFWPPNRNADPRSVWIVLDEKTGRTAALLWKPKQRGP